MTAGIILWYSVLITYPLLTYCSPVRSVILNFACTVMQSKWLPLTLSNPTCNTNVCQIRGKTPLWNLPRQFNPPNSALNWFDWLILFYMNYKTLYKYT